MLARPLPIPTLPLDIAPHRELFVHGGRSKSEVNRACKFCVPSIRSVFCVPKQQIRVTGRGGGKAAWSCQRKPSRLAFAKRKADCGVWSSSLDFVKCGFIAIVI